MEMPGRRSNYSLLSQNPPEEHLYQQPQLPKFPAVAAGGGGAGGYYESHSGEKNNNKGKLDRGVFDWDLIDHRMQSRMGTASGFSSSTGLQRQSSGSSFGESSLSGEYYGGPSLSNQETAFGTWMNDASGGAEMRLRGVEGSGGGLGCGSSSSKSWAQQTEESYQLQLALALRLSSEATCADDPNFLDPVPDESASRASVAPASPEAMSHRFWVNGCLSYFDKIPDGFFLIHGMDPYVWTVCCDLQESGRIPSIDSLKSVDPNVLASVEVITVDRHSDPSLKELQNRVHSMSSTCITTKDVVDQLAKLVCNHLGGQASTGEEGLIPIWKDCSIDLKDCLGSIVLPIGSLSVGLCRHRALLFKVLADSIDLPCRIAKGCKYCLRDEASSCLVRFGLEREYLVDLIGNPGLLCEPDSLLNGPSSISISSPLRLPRFRPVDATIDFRLLAKQYFADCQLLNIVFDDSSSEVITGGNADGDKGDIENQKRSDKSYMDRILSTPSLSNQDEIRHSQLPPHKVRNKDSLITKSQNPISIMGSSNVAIAMQPVPSYGHIGAHRAIVGPNIETIKASRYGEGGQLIPVGPSGELNLDVDDLDIPWSDLVLKEKIGAGSFGTVHRADWNGCDVAVKILMEQDFHAERYNEFIREVQIMKRLRHPNIVLFMGAVTKPPNLSIVTEYLSRGSLYRLLHKPGAREMLDERRRLCMAFDVAKGMNYLHRRNPPIVHRDLKSPNLLVDKKYTVKVCDFGLSRLKANTFLSSKSAAGTPEWMAPEVLRDEPSNEKSDVYSFGVILWELATVQQPWANLNPAQVVAAVGFKGKRLEIPRGLNPQIAAIIEACWANEPWKRPSFYNIMESLKPLIKIAPTAQSSDIPLLT
ncbi:OLC1v1034323C2 [Oldenlandia corymbosa var. corymbosa]|uniref:non-specific serine/threonine protein kinase n=1 Tax=Oldenlandia corymbosa var. corymbosa TaxID=529605 RepID=A0AAV1CSY2_OLDCO|nr:OLC1v1034323C2 [Oldenlandia corymbosa var. corymbosa]